jgi:hypothetical protein
VIKIKNKKKVSIDSYLLLLIHSHNIYLTTMQPIFELF